MSNDVNEFWMPLCFSTVAGLSTCLGATVVFCQPANSKKAERVVDPSQMSFCLALAGSVMITVSVVSILPECLQVSLGNGEHRMIKFRSVEFAQRLLAFGTGCLLYYLLSHFVFPEPPEAILEKQVKMDIGKVLAENESNVTTPLSISRTSSSSLDSQEYQSRRLGSPVRLQQRRALRNEEELQSLVKNKAMVDEENIETPPVVLNKTKESPTKSLIGFSSGTDLVGHDSRRAWRVALLLFISLTCHNFPEGLAVTASSLESRRLGVAVTIGIMIHNIPEGLAIAVPCFAARPNSPWLAFWLAAFSGLAEPLGALCALTVLRRRSGEEDGFFNLQNILSFVAGIMITVAIAELFPEALQHTQQGKGYFWGGTICGIIIMVTTELCLP